MKIAEKSILLQRFMLWNPYREYRIISMQGILQNRKESIGDHYENTVRGFKGIFCKSIDERWRQRK